MNSLYSVWARNGNILIRRRQWLPFLNERKELSFYSMAFHSSGSAMGVSPESDGREGSVFETVTDGIPHS